MLTVNNSDKGVTKKYGTQWFPTEVSCMDHEEEESSSSSSDSEEIPKASMYFEHPSDEGFKLLMKRRTLTETAFRDIDGCIAYEALKQRNDLEILGLIDVLDLKPVAEGLKISTSLMQLWILYIDEGSPQGMRELGNALSENVTLKSLMIDCYHDHLDMDAFLDGITVNTTLENLTLCLEIDNKEELEKRIRSKLQGPIKIEFEDPFAGA